LYNLSLFESSCLFDFRKEEKLKMDKTGRDRGLSCSVLFESV